MKIDLDATGEKADIQRGYCAAAFHASTIQWPDRKIDGHKVMAALEEIGPVGPNFSAGWKIWCDEMIQHAEQARRDAEAYARAMFKRRLTTGLTYFALAAVLTVAGIHGLGALINRRMINNEKQRVQEMAPTIWLGTFQTSKEYYIPGDKIGYPTGRVTRGNASVEIGLRGDGTVVWRKAGPTPGLTATGEPVKH